jgi:hypothetical protein
MKIRPVGSELFHADRQTDGRPCHGSGVCCLPVTAEALLLSQASLCEICGGQSGNGTDIFPLSL